MERPLLTEQIKKTHLHHCQGLLNNLKSSSNRVIIPDEKTWTVDPVRNRRNDCYISFSGEIDETIRTLTMTKHPASVMSLGFVTTYGLVPPLAWFPAGYHLNADDYVNMLKTNLIPWVADNFPDGNVVLQQDGDPAHTSNKAQISSGRTSLSGQRRCGHHTALTETS